MAEEKDEQKKEELTALPEKFAETPLEPASGPLDAEDEKRSGVKEAAANTEAMAVEEQKGKPLAEKLPAKPSFFVDREERHKIDVDILTKKSDGSVVSIARTGLSLNYEQFDTLLHSQEWFEFTLPDYDAMSGYRQKCAVYRREAQQMLVDKVQMRNFLLVWHLKGWSMRDRDGNPVELKHDADGSLTEGSIGKVYRMHSTILDIVLTILEKDLMLV